MVLIVITALLGIFGVAAGLGGFLYKKINWLFRILFIVGGLTLLIPGMLTDVIVLVILAALCIYQKLTAKKEQMVAQ